MCKRHSGSRFGTKPQLSAMKIKVLTSPMGTNLTTQCKILLNLIKITWILAQRKTTMVIKLIFC